MTQLRQYQREMDEYLSMLDPTYRPRLLLHGCCAPCSSYVLEYLASYFDITILYYNPNISTLAEYEKRIAEMRRLLTVLPLNYPVHVIDPGWRQEDFEGICKGLEQEPEGGSRCLKCYELRLRRTAEIAREEDYDCFATTLTISPHKSAPRINEIGERISKEIGVRYLPSDFKKKGGYLRSIELSAKYHLYRQAWCGCVYSMQAQKERHDQSPKNS